MPMKSVAKTHAIRTSKSVCIDTRTPNFAKVSGAPNETNNIPIVILATHRLAVVGSTALRISSWVDMALPVGLRQRYANAVCYHVGATMNLGKDTVVMFNVPSDLTAGDRCVIVGPTDANRNTILNGTMAVGYGAKAGPGSIAIGAHAGAGVDEQATAKRWFEGLSVALVAAVALRVFGIG